LAELGGKEKKNGNDWGSFETDGTDFEPKGLVRLTVIDREEIDNGQLAQLVAANFKHGFTAALAILKWTSKRTTIKVKSLEKKNRKKEKTVLCIRLE
jgi:hypothetical protein